jgi:hypothetical protein
MMMAIRQYRCLDPAMKSWCSEFGYKQGDQAAERVLRSERVRRIELPYSAWEADVLPLNYTRERT